MRRIINNWNQMEPFGKIVFFMQSVMTATLLHLIASELAAHS
jgi:hypothetical protein